MKSSDIQTLEELEARLRKLQDRDNVPSLEELEARLRKLQDRDSVPSSDELEARLARLQDRPYIPSKEPTNEVDKLMQQMESEVRLDKKSDELGIKFNSTPKLAKKRKEFSDKENQELPNRLTKFKEDITISKPANLSFAETTKLIADNIKSQAEMADNIAQKIEEEHKKLLTNTAKTLKEFSKIIGDISPKLEKQESKVFDIIANNLSKIYDGIKKITTPIVNAFKKIGGAFVDSVKLLSKNSSNKQIEESKATLKELYKKYVDLQGEKLDPKVKEQFLKKHYDQIDKLQTPKEMFLETARVTKSITVAGQQKIQKNRQKFKEGHVIASLSPSITPNVKASIKRKSVGREL